jgi:predicted nucleic acid binding AN1-type Zn finger protein
MSSSKCKQCEAPIKYGEEFICNYCKGIFCIEHHLPPKHNCPFIALWNAKPPPKKGKQKTNAFEQLREKLRSKRGKK